MRTFTLRVAHRHLELRPRSIAFKHPWKGRELYWVVPDRYIVSMEDHTTPALGHHCEIKLNQAYFEVGTNQERRAV